VDKIFHQILYEPIDVQPLRGLNVPQTVCDVVIWCTAKQAAERAPSLKAVVDELDWILDPSRPKPARPAAAAATTADGIPLPPAAPPVPAPVQQTSPKPVPVPRPTAARAPASQQAADGKAAPVQGLPGFLGILPSGLRTQAGLMLLAGGAVLVLMALLYVVLSMTHLL
jgi:hypothetical protein